jgi:hypothetical protein
MRRATRCCGQLAGGYHPQQYAEHRPLKGEKVKLKVGGVRKKLVGVISPARWHGPARETQLAEAGLPLNLEMSASSFTGRSPAKSSSGR